jgi:hypothetical protein
MASRLLDLEFRAATIVNSRLTSLTLTGDASNGKSQLTGLTFEAITGSTPGATKKSHLMSLTMTGENNDLTAAISIVPEAPYTQGAPLEPGQKFTLTAAASTGTITGYTFDQTAGQNCPGGLPGATNTRYGVAPLVYPSPIYDGPGGTWIGNDTPHTLTFSVTVTDGVFTSTAYASIVVAPHTIWTQLTPGVPQAINIGGTIPTPGP